jgi:hypothetical protein
MIRDPQHIFVADFGRPVILRTKRGDKQINAIWDDAFFDASVGETVLDTSQKRLTARECDTCGLAREDRVQVGAFEFRVIQVQPDGTGFVTILLSADD